MAYRLHKNCMDFFKNINGLSTQFDYYYLCLMMGFKYKKLGKKEDIKKDSFTKEIIEAYKDSKYKIVGLLIETEIERRGINKNIEYEVEKIISEIIDYNSKDNISDKGIELLNLYAAGGFEKIQSNIEDNENIEYFMQEYLDLIK